jgi:hypothetical protein
MATKWLDLVPDHFGQTTLPLKLRVGERWDRNNPRQECHKILLLAMFSGFSNTNVGHFIQFPE